MKDKITKLVNVYKKNGFIGFNKKLYKYVKANYLDKISFKTMIFKSKYEKEINSILNGNYERIILWRSSFGYNVELFQRPQHIANNLSKQKCLVLYEVTTMSDKVKTFEKIKDNLYLFNFNNILLNKILMMELKKINKPKYFQLYSTDWKLSIKDIENYFDNGFKMIYEYVDHISADLSGTKDIPKYIIDKYEYVMKNDDVYVVTTADELRDDVLKQRGKKNLAISSNGVDYSFFKEFDNSFKLDDEFNRIIQSKKPIFMYYGALAKWFDYDLIKKISKENKYEIILFGIKYDDAFDKSGIEKLKNIHFLGAKDYHILKYYARYADILTIPFLLNDITKSTSPVKIFEYMALNIPIVTTDLKECRKYKSVLIGKTHEEFMKKCEEALTLKNDKKYIKLLDMEAKENDWSKKAMDIIKLIKKDEKEEQSK